MNRLSMGISGRCWVDVWFCRPRDPGVYPWGQMRHREQRERMPVSPSRLPAFAVFSSLFLFRARCSCSLRPISIYPFPRVSTYRDSFAALFLPFSSDFFRASIADAFRDILEPRHREVSFFFCDLHRLIDIFISGLAQLSITSSNIRPRSLREL